METENKNRIIFFLVGFIYFYPALFTFLFPFWIHGLHFETDIFQNFLLSGLLLVFSILFINKRKGYILLLLFLLYFFALIEIFYLVTFRSYLTSSSIFIFFESNTSEISSFTKQYLNFKFCLIILSFVFIYSLFVFLVLKDKINLNFPFFRKFKDKLVMKILLLVGFLVLFFTPLQRSFFPVVFANALIDYKEQIDIYNSIKFNKKSDYFKDVSVEKDTLSEVYVLVIGESTTRNHMGIYGYYRNTTPLLDSISDELIVYNDVISPNTHTLTSLEKVLTLGSTENLDLKYEGNLLQLFNQASYSTYWISNQKPTGIWDNFITGISNSAQKKFFFNISDQKTSHDEVLLDSFEKVLKDEKKKKFIILHLMGSHLLYEDRYPNLFKRFIDKPKTKFKTEVAYETINAYDNSILYQDYIWFNVIKLLKKNSQKAAVLYISDHGEEVYDSIEFSGHTETKGTKSMYEIPFILWLSKSKRNENNDLVYDSYRQYCAEDLIFTMADLASLKFNNFDGRKSILNKNFIPAKHAIINNLAYDSLFKK